MYTTLLAITAFVEFQNNVFYGFRYGPLTTLSVSRDGVGSLGNRITKPALAGAAVRCLSSLDIAELKGFFKDVRTGCFSCCGHNTQVRIVNLYFLKVCYVIKKALLKSLLRGILLQRSFSAVFDFQPIQPMV